MPEFACGPLSPKQAKEQRDRSLSAEIAARLKQRIENDESAFGSLMPDASAIMREYGVTQTVAVYALVNMAKANVTRRTYGGNYRVGPAGTLEPLLTRLLPDELWSIAQSVLPAPKFRPQGGGRGRVDERATFTAILYVLTIGCSWRRLPRELGTCPTAYRRFTEWCEADVWSRWLDAVVKTIDDPALISWTQAVVTRALEREYMRET